MSGGQRQRLAIARALLRIRAPHPGRGDERARRPDGGRDPRPIDELAKGGGRRSASRTGCRCRRAATASSCSTRESSSRRGRTRSSARRRPVPAPVRRADGIRGDRARPRGHRGRAAAHRPAPRRARAAGAVRAGRAADLGAVSVRGGHRGQRGRPGRSSTRRGQRAGRSRRPRRDTRPPRKNTLNQGETSEMARRPTSRGWRPSHDDADAAVQPRASGLPLAARPRPGRAEAIAERIAALGSARSRRRARRRGLRPSPRADRMLASR